jgi:uncharacterized membrane protein YbhN (UPF0104 family)
MKLIGKIILAVGILWYLISSDRLDFKLIAKIVDDPWRLVIGILLTLTNLVLITIRWRHLLKAKSQIPLHLKDIFKINWIGAFFNSVLPGSVSGDIIKIFYVQKIDAELSKRFLLASVFIDRLIGLFALVIIVGISSLLFYQDLTSSFPQVMTMVNFNLLIFLFVIAGISCLFFLETMPLKIIAKLPKQKIIQKVSAQLETIWSNLVLLKGRILFAIFLSLLVQSLAVFTFWYLVSPWADGDFIIRFAFTYIPLGFIAIAIPISPSGLGVGHVAFHQLFSFFGIKNGASLFNISFFVTLFCNILGVIPYLWQKKTKY